MKLGPREDETQLPAAKVAVDHLEVVDADLCFSFGVPRVEMRETVIIEEHRDRDPEEAADRRHVANNAVPTGGSHEDEKFRHVTLPLPATPSTDATGRLVPGRRRVDS
jgi:hypothetical protein